LDARSLERLPYIWIRPEQLKRDGNYAARFGLSGIQPGALRIQAGVVFPETQLEEVAMVLRQPRKDFHHTPEEEYAEDLRALPYDTMPVAGRLLNGELGFEAAHTLLQLDADRGMPMIFASMSPSDGNVQHVAFSRFLYDYFNGRRRFAAEAHDAAAKVLEAEASIEALFVLEITGSDREFPLLERYTKHENKTQRWQDEVRDAADGALARLGSKPHLAKIKQELSQFKGDTFQGAVRLGQILKKAGFAGNPELIDAICPYRWEPGKGGL